MLAYTTVNGSNTNASAVFVPQGMQEVWVGPLAENEAALMLVNKAESLEIVSASFALAGGVFTTCHNVTLYDIFGQRSLGTWNGTEYRATVSPHSAEILRIGCADTSSSTV